MSRLIVKNLPKKYTEDDLKTLFETKGVITNIQLKYNKNGQFRQFAFVGYQHEEEARQAMEYFNNTFVHTSKIKVEVCSNLGDPNKPRAWSKHAPDSSYNINKQKINKSETKLKESLDKKSKKKADKTDDILAQKMKEDPGFEEFMQLHKADKKIWTNDTAVDGNEHNEDESEEEKGTDDNEDNPTDHNTKLTDSEYFKSKVVKKNSSKVESDGKKLNEFTIKVQGFPMKVKKSLIKEFFKPLHVRDIRRPKNLKGITYVQFTKEDDIKRALTKHRSFLEGKRVHITKCQVKATEVVDEKNNKWQNLTAELNKNAETIVESGSLFVRNLSYTATEDDLHNFFSTCGPIAEIRLPIDKFTRKIKGFAIIEYVIPQNALDAFSKLDGSVFQGRILHILPGKSKPESNEDNNEDKSFKKTKSDKQKKESTNSYNWNSLFLGTNAVADVISDKYNTSKQDLLGAEGSESVAVRMALGETQIVIETKNFLQSNGVNLEAFQPGTKCERSKTIILVKNLPANTSSDKITKIFTKYGAVGRVILPPSGVTAIVEYHDSFEAKKAFKSLAYTQFESVPLYLEWAPETVLQPQKTADEKEESQENKAEVLDKEVVETQPELGSLLYVKNLNFDTTEESLKAHFAKHGSIHSVTVAKKPDVKNAGQFLSMGYGFVQFTKKSNAADALKYSQNSILDDHCLELKISDRTTNKDLKPVKSKSAKVTEQNSAKILIRNIPFEATIKEISNLFRTFGEVKAVRLPKKMSAGESGTHRGFAFVEFVTKADAKKAFEALRHSTHLYGRRLVLEWADSESESLETLRMKTARKYQHQQDAPAPKKLRKEAILEQLMTSSSADDKHA